MPLKIIRIYPFLAAVSLVAGSSSIESYELETVTSHGDSDTLFDVVKPDLSGVTFENRYDHPERWRKLWHQYFLGTIGTGVALGDVNSDGLPDIFTVGKDSPNALYLNLGDWRFENATESAGASGHDGIGAGTTMLDIDNDGDLDIYVTYTGSPNELFINDGKGVFTEAASSWGLDVNTGSNAPSFADYDRDGDLDLYLQCNFLTASGLAEGMPDLFYENTGHRFVDRTVEAGITGNGQGHAAIWWDYDEDGWPDIYIANDFEPADKLYRNNRDGTFSDVINEVLVSAPYSAMGADFGDINNDGHVDFIVAEMATRDHEKYHRTVGAIGTKLLRSPTSTVSQYMKNMLSVKIGPEQYAEVSYLSGLDATDWTWAARLADLDNDGLQDAFFTNGMVRAFHDGDVGLKSKNAKTGWQRMSYFKASPQYDEENLSFKNLGEFQFSNTSKEWGLDMLGVSFSAAFADFDLDGDLDIVVSNMEKNLTLYRNNSEENNRVTIRLIGVESNRYGVGAKVVAKVGEETMVRDLSLTRGYLSSDEPVVHFGLGNHTGIDQLTIHWPSGNIQNFHNLDVNRRYLITEEESSGGEIVLGEKKPVFVKSKISIPDSTKTTEEYFQLFPMQILVPEILTKLGPTLRVNDLDRDGWKDVILGGPTGLETRVFRNLNGQKLEWVESDSFEDDFDSEDSGIVAFDYDGDDDLDLIVSSGGIELREGDEYYTDRVYENIGGIRFERLDEGNFDFDSKASGAILLLDVNGDGVEDLITAGGTRRELYPDYEDNRIYLREDGRYVLDSESEFSKQFLRSGSITDLLAEDIDGDGDKDLLQLVRWGAPKLWKNNEGDFSEETNAFESDKLKGWWRSVSAGDFDGDGRMDLVLGNIGENTVYRASVDKPVVLFAPGNEYLKNTYIETYTMNGELFPIENRMLHDIQFPELMDKTSSSVAEFARQTIHEIIPEELLSQYVKYEMTETRSMILYQREPGEFTSEPLPIWAQSGVIVDSLAVDVNSDGHLDLIVSHEMRAPKLWADRDLRGHLSLFVNDGNGGFETLLPWDSGLQIHGHPRELAWADMNNDGAPELIVSMNEGPLLVFELNSSN